MSVSVIPAFIDAMVTALTAALPAVIVHDGFGISDDPSDFLMIGVDDPDPQSSGQSANSVREQIGMSPASTSYREDGHVICAAYSWNGNANLKTARDSVYTICNAVDNALRTTRVAGPSPSVLGVASVMDAKVTEVALQQEIWQTADALLIITVSFIALT